jgi:hypothetical protein
LMSFSNHSEWPIHGRYLVPGVNDTWNCYQKFCRGNVVTASQWKAAKAELAAQYAEYYAGSWTNVAATDHR